MQAVIVADDLTGANVIAAHLVSEGWRARVVTMAGQAVGPGIEEALILNIHSRLLSGAHAYARVRETIERLGDLGGRLLVKRVDSTARGNLGSEIDAAIDASRRRLCWAVFADPINGKQTIDGRLLINGVPVDLIPMAHDRLNPLPSAAVAELIGAQSRHRLVPVPLSVVRAGRGEVRAYVRAIGEAPAILVCDCASVDDLAMLADVAVEMGEPVLAADPGPFTARVAARSSSASRPPVFLACGSIQANVLSQLDEIRRDPGVRLLELAPGARDTPGFRDSVRRWVDAVTTPPIPAVIGVYSSFDRVPQAADGDRVIEDLAAVVAFVLEQLPQAPAGLVLAGGQTAAAVCAAMGITEMTVVGSILPYTVASFVGGGRWSGLPVVTKGGLIGDHTALVRSVEYVRTCWKVVL